MKPLTSLTLAAVLLVIAATLTFAGTAGTNLPHDQATASYMEVSFLNLKLRLKPIEFSR